MLSVILIGALSGTVFGYIAWNLSSKKYEIDNIGNQPEPQSMVPSPIETQSYPAPTIQEKVEPTPSLKPIPHKAAPPIIKKDTTPKLKEIIPDKSEGLITIQPKEKLADVLIRKYPPTDPALERIPKFFIQEWLNVIKKVNGEMIKQDLQTVMRVRVRLRDGISDDAHIAEARFTLHCLESEGYIQITETPEPLHPHIGLVIYNLQSVVSQRYSNRFNGLMESDDMRSASESRSS